MNAPLLAAALAVWALGWAVNSALARRSGAWVRVVVPAVFGATVLLVWEWGVRGAGVPPVLLPAPSAIAARLAGEAVVLRADLMHTFGQATLTGFGLGCGGGFALALAIDRAPFLQRGLLPLASLASALPIVGIAPIMVAWFGVDWPSKAAVAAVMTLFPMLVATRQGLAAAAPADLDLMRGYGAGYWATLWHLRLPLAAPFVFTGLKVCSALALIGAIVAEFFASHTVGMGFRISSEMGRMNVDMVWATIAVAALAGSVFYGVIAAVERWVTFWHPSVRG